MSYSEKEVVGMLAEIGDSFNLYKGKMETRFTALEEQGDAVEKAVAKQDGQYGGVSGQKRSEFSGLGDFCRAVASASRPGGSMDPRLARVQAAATGANEGIPSEGGFLIEKTLIEPLTVGIFDVGLLAKRCFRVPVGGNANGLKIPAISETSRVNGSRFGGVQSYWAAEAATVTKTKPTFREMELNLHKLMALSYVTEELLQDSAALGRILQQSFLDEFSFKIDDAILNGTGVGQPLGIMNSPCLVSVPKEAGQGADTVVFENILKIYSRMLPRSRKTACWLISQSIEPQLFTMSVGLGLGGVPVYLPATGAAGAPYATLMGLPVIAIEQCATLGDKGDIVLADLGSYIIADKGGIQSAMSPHVAFEYAENCFRWLYRIDGQTMFNAPIVPFKGSAALSAFITLDARP